MGYELIIIEQIAKMFLYLVAGVWLYRAKLVTEAGSGGLSGFLLYLVLPCTIINSFGIENNAANTFALITSFGVGVLVLVIAIAVSALMFRKDPMSNFAGAFSNAGFIGIPLVSSVLGNHVVFFLAGMIALLNVLQWIYGQWLLSNGKQSGALSAVWKNPLLVGFGLGLLRYVLPFQLLDVASNTVEMLANCSAPVAMIILGGFIGKNGSIKALLSWDVFRVSVVRLILIPLITMLVLKQFSSVPYEIRLALLIAAAAPVGANIALYVQRLDKDVARATMMVCGSTLLSILTMPLNVILIDLFW